ncbi:MAG TPA: hypothetical protein VIU61_02325, partial [Kofleriaceae bacterium]
DSPALPLLDSEPPPEDDDDDDGFPEVDSTDATVASRPSLPPASSFGVASRASAESLPALSPPQPIATHRRNVVWPLLAFAMVGITGGALYLVWKQSQQQQPMDVKIISEPAPSAPREPDPEPSPPPPETPKRGSGIAPRKTQPPAKKDPYNEAIRARRAAANKCAQEHGAPPPGARVEIIITTDGKPKSVQLAPANLNSTPLGGCIKNVFSSAVFPSDKNERKVDFTLTAS